MNAVVDTPLSIAAGDSAHRTIPFDQTLRFEIAPSDEDRTPLQPGLVQISVEAPFVVVGIGYGFVASEATKDFGPPPGVARTDTLEVAFQELERELATAPRGDLTLATVLRNGWRINPKYGPQLLPRDPQTGKPLAGFSFSRLKQLLPQDLFQALLPAPSELQFLYAMYDQGSGRAFQSEPVLSTAGLGGPDGKRPFRQFAVPVRLAPQTTLRFEVTLIRPAVYGQLHFSLHGYKVLGTEGSPTDFERIARLARQRSRRR